MTKSVRTVLIWVLLAVAFFAIYQFVKTEPTPKPERVSVQAFDRQLEAGTVAIVWPAGGELLVETREGAIYRTPVQWSDPLRDRVVEAGVEIAPIREPLPTPDKGGDDGTLWGVAAVGALVVALIFLILRRLSANPTSILALKRTTARLVSDIPRTGFKDVGGAEEVKSRLGDVVDFLKNPARWERSGARLPHGVLLEGPPGFGKTLMARAVAGEAKVPFFEVSASEFVELFVGVGAARMRNLFEEARKKAPSVVFIDELDAVGRKRGAAASTALIHQEREQALNQLLVCLDGFQTRARVVVMAATNRADVLDPALLRPGRFDVRLKISEYSTSARRDILEIHTRGKPLSPKVNLDLLAEKTHGMSGADLEHLCNEAALIAARRDAEGVQISVSDFDEVLARRSDNTRFDKLDLLVVESTTQLAQPTGRAIVRARLRSGEVFEGKVVWMDSSMLKLDAESGGVLLNRSEIVTLEAREGTETAPEEEMAKAHVRLDQVGAA